MTDQLVLIDTSAWILAFRPKHSRKVIHEVDYVLIENRAATAGVIVFELLGGTRTEKEYFELRDDLLALHYLPFTDELWLMSSKLSFALRRKGITVPNTDILIATLAIENNCVLLHADVHFDMISKFSKLKSKNLLR